MLASVMTNGTRGTNGEVQYRPVIIFWRPVQATGQRALRVDLANGLLGMAAAAGALAALMTSLRLGSGFLPAMWAFAALVGIPAYGRVSSRSTPRLPTNAPERRHAALVLPSPVLYGPCTLVGPVCRLGGLRVSAGL